MYFQLEKTSFKATAVNVKCQESKTLKFLIDGNIIIEFILPKVIANLPQKLNPTLKAKSDKSLYIKKKLGPFIIRSAFDLNGGVRTIPALNIM